MKILGNFFNMVNGINIYQLNLGPNLKFSNEISFGKMCFFAF